MTDYAAQGDVPITDPYGKYSMKRKQHLTGVRKVIAKRLGEGWRSNVPVTLHRRIDVGPIEELRSGPKDDRQKLSFIDYVLLALVQTLKESEKVNAIFDGNTVRSFEAVNLGIAVDSPRGLVVPVVHNAGVMDIYELREHRKRLIELARTWRQQPDDLVGGTFTVSNLASLGVEYFTPIINPPQVAILGLGQVTYQPCAPGRTQELRTRALLPVSLTFDHQVIDGAEAAQFLADFQDQIKELTN